MARHHLIVAGPLMVLGLVASGCGDDPTIDSLSLVEGLAAAVVPEDPEIVTDVVVRPEQRRVARERRWVLVLIPAPSDSQRVRA